MDKKLALDIGNVICRVDLEKFYTFLVNDKDIFPNKDQANIFFEGVQNSMDLGLYSIKHAFRKYIPGLSEKDLKDIRDFWMGICVISSDMLLFLKELEDRKIQVAVLSNIGVDHASLFSSYLDKFNCIKFFSCNIGTRKPSKFFFQIFQDSYNWQKNTYFFDDRAENVDAAKNYFNSVQFNLYDYKDDSDGIYFLKSKLGLNK
jgi:FMN phosphatase YigB (HAD superfamily)